MKRKILLIITLVVVLLPASLFATITSITGVTLTPPPASAGAAAQVNFSYTTSTNNDNPGIFILISDTTTPRNNGTAGQWLMIGNGCSTPADPINATSDPGCQIGGLGASGTYAGGPYNFNLPVGLIPGVPYYVLVCMGTNWCKLNGTPLNVEYTGISAFFTLPLPPGSATITKTVENNQVLPGDLILYTIEYNVVNSDLFTITDSVPANCTLISQSIGGINTGTTPGSTVSWPVGNISTPTTGKVWFIVQVDGTASVGTVSNTSNCTATDHDTSAPISGLSNTASFVIGSPFSIVNSQLPLSPGSAAIGNTITYTLDFHAGGESFQSYDSFDLSTDMSNFIKTGNGPGFSWVSDAVCNGCIFSNTQDQTAGIDNYPHITRNTPDYFCYGDIQGDIYIGAGGGGAKNDGLIVFGDNRLTGGTGCSYGAGISPDGPDGSVNHSFWIQKYCGVAAGSYAFGSPVLTVNANTWYTVKIRVTDAGSGTFRIQGKAWVRGNPEPASWAIDWPDSLGTAPACGFVGFQGHPTNTNHYDNLKILKSTETNPIVYDTIPTIITYSSGSIADLTHGAAVNTGGMVKWNINTSLTDQVYSLTWLGTVNYCGDAFNKVSFITHELAVPVDSNTTSLNVAVCPQTATVTPSWTSTPTQTFTRTITPTSTRTATLTNTPTFTATPSATTTNTPVLYPTLVFVKAAAPNPALEGETVNYTITYSNSGPVDANNVSIIDLLDTKLSYVPASGGTHNGINPGGQIDWLIANIPAVTGTGTISFSAVVASNLTSGTVIQNQTSANCLESSTPVLSNLHILNLNIPVLKLTPVVNVPNPGNTYTDIIFNLTTSAEVTIKLYTISGEVVRVMEPAEVTAQLQPLGSTVRSGDNRCRWDCKNGKGKPVASGIYFYRVDAKKGSENPFYISKLAVLR